MTGAMRHGSSRPSGTFAPANAPPTSCIAADEIVPGLVVRLNPCVLSADPEVCNTQDPPVTRTGLFVCVAVVADVTTWAGLTTQSRPERLLILPEWRSGGYRRWQLTSQYLTDGASLWSGPRGAFVAASSEEVFSRSRNRARVSPAGLDAIREEITAQGSRRHRSSAAVDALSPLPPMRRAPRRRRRRSR